MALFLDTIGGIIGIVLCSFCNFFMETLKNKTFNSHYCSPTSIMQATVSNVSAEIVIGTPWSSRQRGVYVEMSDEEEQEDELATAVGTPWSSRQRGVYVEMSDEEEQEDELATAVGTPWSNRKHGEYLSLDGEVLGQTDYDGEVVQEAPMRFATTFGEAHVESIVSAV